MEKVTKATDVVSSSRVEYDLIGVVIVPIEVNDAGSSPPGILLELVGT